MPSATTLITDALQNLGVLSAGQSPSATDLTDGLRRLNNLIDLWATSSLMVPYRTQITKVLTGAQSYTIGTGGDINTTRPAAIESAFVRETDTDYPLYVARSRGEYDGIMQKGMTGMPWGIYYEPSLPLGRIFVWPVGSAIDTLYLSARGQLTSFPDTTTDVTLAPGYAILIHSNLALALAPVYEATASQEVVKMATESMAAVKRLNRQSPVMSFDSAIPGVSAGYNIETG